MTVALRDLLRGRLALRIYLVGLAQIAVVAIGFFALLHWNRPAVSPVAGEARFVAGTIAGLLDDRPALERELSRARDDLRLTVTVIDPDGAVVASTARPGARRCPRPDGAAVDNVGPRCRTASLPFPDGRLGRIEYAGRGRRPPPPVNPPVIAFVLVVVGVSSWLLARTLTGPLRQLSIAARAFGEGDLKARAAVARRDELGEVARAFDEMADRVTELLRAEKELLANVSHELRTPLARIRVALDLAAEGDAEVARASLADIAGDLDELERLISDVLTAARLDLADGASPAGIPPLRREQVDVAGLLDQSVSRFRAAHPERALHVDMAADLPVVDGDPVLLRRVVDNLLENAHKYTERDEDPVELVARGGEGVSIDVIDRGIGIAADDLARVFRPFFRADRSRTRKTGGLGLGLALAKRIVDAHGGTIALTSVPNEGTRAQVTLPVAGTAR